MGGANLRKQLRTLMRSSILNQNGYYTYGRYYSVVRHNHGNRRGNYGCLEYFRKSLRLWFRYIYGVFDRLDHIRDTGRRTPAHDTKYLFDRDKPIRNLQVAHQTRYGERGRSLI